MAIILTSEALNTFKGMRDNNRPHILQGNSLNRIICEPRDNPVRFPFGENWGNFEAEGYKFTLTVFKRDGNRKHSKAVLECEIVKDLETEKPKMYCYVSGNTLLARQIKFWQYYVIKSNYGGHSSPFVFQLSNTTEQFEVSIVDQSVYKPLRMDWNGIGGEDQLDVRDFNIKIFPGAGNYQSIENVIEIEPVYTEDAGSGQVKTKTFVKKNVNITENEVNMPKCFLGNRELALSGVKPSDVAFYGIMMNYKHTIPIFTGWFTPHGAPYNPNFDSLGNGTWCSPSLVDGLPTDVIAVAGERRNQDGRLKQVLPAFRTWFNPTYATIDYGGLGTPEGEGAGFMCRFGNAGYYDITVIVFYIDGLSDILQIDHYQSYDILGNENKSISINGVTADGQWVDIAKMFGGQQTQAYFGFPQNVIESGAAILNVSNLTISDWWLQYYGQYELTNEYYLDQELTQPVDITQPLSIDLWEQGSNYLTLYVKAVAKV